MRYVQCWASLVIHLTLLFVLKLIYQKGANLTLSGLDFKFYIKYRSLVGFYFCTINKNTSSPPEENLLQDRFSRFTHQSWLSWAVKSSGSKQPVAMTNSLPWKKRYCFVLFLIKGWKWRRNVWLRGAGSATSATISTPAGASGDPLTSYPVDCQSSYVVPLATPYPCALSIEAVALIPFDYFNRHR